MAFATPVTIGVTSVADTRMIEANCADCGARMKYPYAGGRPRTYCSGKECSAARLRRNQSRRRGKATACSIEGCERLATRVGKGLCEACYYQIRRTGSPHRKSPSATTLHSGGYLKTWAPDHPLATDGRVLEHRLVLYDILGPSAQECFWCGVLCEWKELVVDHLNECKVDNRPENLVPSCNRCNRARGSVIPLVDNLQDEERFEALVAALRSYFDRLAKERAA